MGLMKMIKWIKDNISFYSLVTMIDLLKMNNIRVKKIKNQLKITKDNRQTLFEKSEQIDKQHEEITTLKEGDDRSPTVTDASTNKVKATIPVTLNDNNTLDLEIMEGQNVEDAVVAFCREHVKADVSACIRQLLPEVLEKYNAEDKMLRGQVCVGPRQKGCRILV